MNTYQIQYLGLLAERRGLPSEMIEQGPTTPEELYLELSACHSLGLAVRDVRVAVNDEFSPWDRTLENGDRIAFLPPMSGG